MLPGDLGSVLPYKSKLYETGLEFPTDYGLYGSYLFYGAASFESISSFRDILNLSDLAKD